MRNKSCENYSVRSNIEFADKTLDPAEKKIPGFSKLFEAMRESQGEKLSRLFVIFVAEILCTLGELYGEESLRLRVSA